MTHHRKRRRAQGLCAWLRCPVVTGAASYHCERHRKMFNEAARRQRARARA